MCVNSAMGVRVAAGVAVGEVPVAGVGVHSVVWWRWRGVAAQKLVATAKMRSSDFLAIAPPFTPLQKH